MHMKATFAFLPLLALGLAACQSPYPPPASPPANYQQPIQQAPPPNFNMAARVVSKLPPCHVIRGNDKLLYAVQPGALEGFGVGQPLVVVGTVHPGNLCGAATWVTVQQVYRR